MAVPEAMPTGPARRGLLTGVRSFPFRNYVPTPGLPVGPGWISIQDNQPIVTEVLGEAGVETGYCTDNPFLDRAAVRELPQDRRQIKPSFSQGAYRFLNKPFKRPAPRSAIERYLLPELSDSVEVGRLRSMVGWNSIYRDTDNDYPTARVFRSAINIVDDLKKKRPFFLGADGFDPHEPLDAPRIFQNKYGGPKGIEVTKGITPIQPFETPYSWVIDMKLDPDTIERVRELYAAEIAFTDEWIGRLMNRLADQNLLDETVVIYSSDHGLTLGEQGIVGKHGARAQWHIYHVPFFIRHPEGKLAGQWDVLRVEPRHLEDGDVVHGRPAAGDDDRRGPVGDLRREAPARAPALHLLLRRLRARRRRRVVLPDRQLALPPAAVRPEEGPAPGAQHRGPAPRHRREVLAHPLRRGRRHAAAVQPRRREAGARRMSFTRRTLLRRGGATAAGAGVLGSLTRAAPAAAKLGDDRARGVVIIVLPLVRSSHVGAFKDGGHAKTPNLNDLTGKSLRANRSLPESMPAVSARRALVTGMRAFPFRDWRRLEGFPSVPGFNPVWDYQPLLIERTREAGVQTIYVTDNPLFQGPRFEGVRAPGDRRRRVARRHAPDRARPGADQVVLAAHRSDQAHVP